jgi:hypothetical protein
LENPGFALPCNWWDYYGHLLFGGAGEVAAIIFLMPGK